MKRVRKGKVKDILEGGEVKGIAPGTHRAQRGYLWKIDVITKTQ